MKILSLVVIVYILSVLLFKHVIDLLEIIIEKRNYQKIKYPTFVAALWPILISIMIYDYLNVLFKKIFHI